MPIKVLPTNEHTRTLLSSWQATPTPVAVVKELVENAIDAQATSISLEIAADALSSIQVRDNGRGIAPEDRCLVGLAGCTSKLDSWEEMSSVKTLGFRGQALAALASTAGTVTIETKCELEDVGERWILGNGFKNGGTSSRSHIVRSVGTTVKVDNFLHGLPVRQRHFFTRSSKSIAAIKTLLKALSFAWPGIRFCSKVSSPADSKSEWTYAPAIGGKFSVMDAATKVINRECSVQCVWIARSDAASHLTIEALLPKPEARSDGLYPHGAFVSVNKRPLDASKGIAKAIKRMFRTTLKNAGKVAEFSPDPFFVMNIECPSEHCDLNIEPLKNDVLFANEDKVLSFVDNVLLKLYPLHYDLAINKYHTNQSVDLVSKGHRNNNHVQSDRVWHTGTGWQDDIGEEETELNVEIRKDAGIEPQEELEEYPSINLKLNNPWTLAKMNASTRKERPYRSQEPRPSLPVNLEKDTNSTLSKNSVERQHLPTPESSSPSRQICARENWLRDNAHSDSNFGEKSRTYQSEYRPNLISHIQGSIPATSESRLPVCGTARRSSARTRGPQRYRVTDDIGVNKPFISPVVPQERISSIVSTPNIQNSSRPKLRQTDLKSYTAQSRKPAMKTSGNQESTYGSRDTNENFQLQRGYSPSPSPDLAQGLKSDRADSQELDPSFFVKYLQRHPNHTTVLKPRETQSLTVRTSVRDIELLTRSTAGATDKVCLAFIKPLKPKEKEEWIDALARALIHGGNIDIEAIEHALSQTFKLFNGTDDDICL